MTAIMAGPFALACLLLVVAGVSKAAHPRSTAAQRALGAVEVALGAVAFVHQNVLAAGAVAAMYAGFVLIAGRAKAKQRACGCFGGDERLPSTGHVVLNGVLAASALAAIAGQAEASAPIAYAGVTYAILMATATYLGTAVMTQ
jgi:hypothetical protein